MKNKYLLTTVLSALIMSGCNGTTGGSTNSSSPETSVSISTSIVNVEVEKKFNLTISACEGTTITLVNPQDNYSAGSVVEFTVTVDKTHLELDTVTYDGKVLHAENGVYSFVVLNKDATVATTVVERGSENLLDVSDVDSEMVPTNATELKAALENAKALESVYASSATYDSTYDETRSLTATMGHNDVVVIEGKKLPYASSNLYSYERVEKGLWNNRLYEVDDGTTSVTYQKGVTIKSIVADETENVLASQVKASDADLAVKTSGFIDKALSFFTTSTNSFLSTDNYGWKETRVSSEVSEDNKSYTTTATAYYSSYRRFITFSATFDGDNFLTSVDFDSVDYGYSDVETYTVTVGEGDEATEVTYHRPVEGAESTKHQTIDLGFTRGYRSKLEKTDLTNAATSDYDVFINYRIDGDYTTYTVGEDNEIKNSAEMNFVFRQKEVKPIFLLPTLIGAKEEGFVTYDDYNTPVVSNVGDFTLLFDNGLGEIKEVPLTSVRPDAKSMTAALSSSTIYNGESSTLTAAITPAGADQSVTVTVKDGSTAGVELTENEDGTWNVKGVTNGSGTLVVTSVANPSLTKEVTFTVEDKPNIDDIKAFLTTNTLFGKVSGWGSHFVNFNEDGTGSYVCYEGTKGDVIPFTWTLDENTISLSIEVDGSLKSNYYNLGGFANLTSSSITLLFLYNGSAKEAVLSQLDSKLDLATVSNLGSY